MYLLVELLLPSPQRELLRLNSTLEGQIENIVGIAASVHMETQARALGIPLTTLAEHPVIDLTIDGADEVDPDLNLIKGGGGALLREKIVAQATRREVIVVDNSKPADHLGTDWPVPVEVIPFGWQSQAEFLRSDQTCPGHLPADPVELRYSVSHHLRSATAPGGQSGSDHIRLPQPWQGYPACRV